MFWEDLFKNLLPEVVGLALGILIELIFWLFRKSLFLTAPYVRLWKETVLLHRILNDQRFAQWKSKAARYVALHAIKARSTKQEPLKLCWIC